MQTNQTKSVRKNIQVFFGHENWNLVMNMMIGIRNTIKSLDTKDDLELLPNDFSEKCEY